MVSIQRVIGFLSREFGVSGDPRLTGQEQALADELFAVLRRCDREHSFVQDITKLLLTVNESQSFANLQINSE
jgi:hypothetical protein